MPLRMSLPNPEVYCIRIQNAIGHFYRQNPQIGESHGISHVMAVHNHAVNAIESHKLNSVKLATERQPQISETTAMEIRVAAMLHDVDDRKYFPAKNQSTSTMSLIKSDGETIHDLPNLPNALKISETAEIPAESICRILKMIQWVGCTANGNSIPPEIKRRSDKDESSFHAKKDDHYEQMYYLLIPRWADRLEAVGAIGVVRCYQYNREIGAPLWKDDDPYDSPRAKSPEEVWRYATPERFENYLKNERGEGGKKNKKANSSMISHYYDKLLHVARPPPELVKNFYLEEMARESSRELVEVCLRFGQTGKVDEEYILDLEKKLSEKKT